MRSRLSYTIISFVLILVVSLGNSLAGTPMCPTVCPECVVVPDCCAGMADHSESGTSGTADHSPERTDCSHDGICLNGFQPIDVSATTGTIEFDSAVVQYQLISEVHLDLLYKVVTPVPPQSFSEKFPPLYLRNCSFLI